MERVSVGTFLETRCLAGVGYGKFWLAFDHFSIIPRERLLALPFALDPGLICTIDLSSSNLLYQSPKTSVAVLVDGRVIDDSEVLASGVFGTTRRPWWRGRQ